MRGARKTVGGVCSPKFIGKPPHSAVSVKGLELRGFVGRADELDCDQAVAVADERIGLLLTRFGSGLARSMGEVLGDP
jgi:hypothetical protein